MKDFAVVYSQHYDNEHSVFLFDTEEEAVEFLRNTIKHDIQLCVSDDECSTNFFISQDGKYAKFENIFDDGDDPVYVTEMRVARVCDKNQEMY